MYITTVGELRNELKDSTKYPDDMQITNRAGDALNEVEKEADIKYASDEDEEGTDTVSLMLGFVGD